MAKAQERYAVVTGGNKGIGLEICKQLASKGVTTVVLTARDEKKGTEAVENLKQFGFSNVVFHQLDVTDLASIASLADCVKTKYGKLDILVNNAGILGFMTDADGFRAVIAKLEKKREDLGDTPITETYDTVEACLKTNYYGAKRMCETFIPLLQLSDSPRIVNVSSIMGKLKNIPNEWAKAILSDGDNLREEKVDEALNKYLKDFKQGSWEAKGWPAVMSAYILSKAAMNAYTRILAKKHPVAVGFCINSVCTGYVKTEINYNTGILTVEEGVKGPVRLALLPDGGPSGLFFSGLEESEL